MFSRQSNKSARCTFLKRHTTELQHWINGSFEKRNKINLLHSYHWTLIRLERYLRIELWSQRVGWHVSQYAGHPSPRRDETTWPIAINLTYSSVFLWEFSLLYPKKAEGCVSKTGYLSELTVQKEIDVYFNFCLMVDSPAWEQIYACFGPTWLPPFRFHSIVESVITN